MAIRSADRRLRTEDGRSDGDVATRDEEPNAFVAPAG
jgi:hypothetical protein